jgi:hypothetical protein
MIDHGDGAIEGNLNRRATGKVYAANFHVSDISLLRRFMHKFPTAFTS